MLTVAPPDPDSSAADHILPFIIEGTDVRGRLVRTGPVMDDILSRHGEQPEVVLRLLGEAVTLAALLGSGMKFDGKVIVQVRGDGPVSMLVADYAAGGGIRGAVALSEDKDVNGERGLGLLGKGHMAITVDPGEHMRRYQGVTPLEGETLAEAAEHYFDRSEQIPTRLKMAVGRELRPGAQDRWRASGLLLQHVPQGAADPDAPPDEDLDARGVAQALSEKQEDDWARSEMLLATLRDDELLDDALPSSDLVFRLFHEDGVRAYAALPLERVCSCSRQKLVSLFSQFSAEELQDMRDESGDIVAVCEFCRTEYRFGEDIS